MSAPVSPITATGGAGHEMAFKAALLAAEMAERGADMILASYAAAKAIADATNLREAHAMVEALETFGAVLTGLEIADPAPARVPAEIIAMLGPHLPAGVEVLREVPAPVPQPGTFADGVKTGLARARLLAQARRPGRGGLRR
jgi:hypothetical protein